MICTKFKEYLRHKTNVPREISLSLLNECVNEAFAYITQTKLIYPDLLFVFHAQS